MRDFLQHWEKLDQVFEESRMVDISKDCDSVILIFPKARFGLYLFIILCTN